MIRIRIPGQLPKLKGDLRIIYHIGTLGFTYSEVLSKSQWKPGSIIYAPPDTESIEFEIIGKINSRISSQISSVLAPIENKRR